jgi:hypothetical protein
VRIVWFLLVGVALAACSSSKSSGGGGGAGGPVHGQVFPDDNPWNTDISKAPVDPKSDAYITNIGANTGLHADFDAVGDGIPFVFVSGDQKKVPVTFDNAEESDPGPYALPDDAPIENGGDGHCIAVDFDNGKLYELYVAEHSGGKWSAASGAIFDLNSNMQRPAGWTSADAAGLPIFPGLVRYDEVIQQKVIDHALRFTASRTMSGYVAPALHSAGDCAVGSCDAPPMGLRVRLKASVDISGYPPSAQVILTALKKYGMFLADNGSSWFISGEPNEAWIDDDIRQISGIKGRDFEAIETGPITPLY